MKQRFCMNCMRPLDEDGNCPFCPKGTKPDTSAHHLIMGSVLHERYLLGRVLGQGGFGITYIGFDLTLQLRVAVKEYYPNGYAVRNASFSPEITIPDKHYLDAVESGMERFLNEARILARFRGTPGIVDVLDYFEDNGTAYIVMEYLEGQTLKEWVQKEHFSADAIFTSLQPILDALDKIHKEGVIHRDISPDNVMRLADGSLKLMDFGAAKTMQMGMPKSQSIFLKGGYAPTEQYSAKGEIGPWTDIYSLCATIYQCITGIVPEDALSRLENDTIQWPSALQIPISKQQEQVLQKGMALSAKDRYQSIAEMQDALQEPEELPRRRKGRVLAVCAAAVLLLLALLLIPWKGESIIRRMLEGSPSKEAQVDRVYHVKLQADEDISVRALKASMEILQERIRLLADGKDYELRTDGSMADLTIPAECFAGMDIRKVLRTQITRPMQLYVYNANADVFLNVNKDTALIPRSAIEEVLLGEDSIDLVLSETQCRMLKERIGAGNELGFGLDAEMNPSYSFDQAEFLEAENTVRLTFRDMPSHLVRLMQYCLSEEPLACSFSFEVDLDSATIWEPARKNSMQCDADAITEPAVILLYRANRTDLTDGQVIDLADVFRDRLDILESPYAFSCTKEEDDFAYITVKITLEHMGETLIEILKEKGSSGYNIDLFTPSQHSYLSKSGFLLEFVKNESDLWEAQLKAREPESYNAEQLGAFLQEEEGTKVWLAVDGIPVLEGTISKEQQNSGEMRFTENAVTGLPVTEDDLWFTKLLTALWEDSLNIEMELEQRQFLSGTDQENVSANDFGYRDHSMLQAAEAITAAYPDASCYFNMRTTKGTLAVSFARPLNSSFPADCLATAKDIYQRIPYDTFPYRLILYMTEEPGDERARIIFDYEYYGQEHRKNYIYGRFYGERIGTYADTFRNLISQDAFFAEKEGEGTLSWIFEESTQ